MQIKTTASCNEKLNFFGLHAFACLEYFKLLKTPIFPRTSGIVVEKEKVRRNRNCKAYYFFKRMQQLKKIIEQSLPSTFAD